MTVKSERFHTKGHLHQMALSIRYRGAELGRKGEQVATPQLFLPPNIPFNIYEELT